MARTLHIPFFNGQCLIGLCFLFLILNGPSFASSPGPQLLLLNVGEGASQLLMTEDRHACLIDTGNPISGTRILRLLQSENINELECIIITHPHPDHMGGIFTILGLMKVKRIYDNGQPIQGRPNCDILRWYDNFVRKRKNYSFLRAGDTLKLSKLVEISCLWPERGKPFSRNWNENSLVLMIHLGEKRVLIMGDATKKVEAELLSTSRIGPVDGLVVGHHGAGDATGNKFLASANPKWAYISVDRDNIRGYPSDDTLMRLKRAGIRVLLSFLNGNCKVGTVTGIVCSNL